MSDPTLRDLLALAVTNRYSLDEVFKLVSDTPVLAELRIDDRALSIFPSKGPTSYSMSADPGDFVVKGRELRPLVRRMMSAATATFGIEGKCAAREPTYFPLLQPAPGSYRAKAGTKARKVIIDVYPPRHDEPYTFVQAKFIREIAASTPFTQEKWPLNWADTFLRQVGLRKWPEKN